jgi:hypothetical protein
MENSKTEIILAGIEENVIMTSNEISELTGKRHDNIIRDIEKMMCNKIFLDEITLSSYKDKQNKERKNFIVSNNVYKALLSIYKGLDRIPNRIREEASLKAIEQILNISLIRQYRILNYRIDGYHLETNTCYEIDEPEHSSRKKQDKIRQDRIENILKCKFVRIKL